MNKPKGFEKPSGVKDYLPDTVAKLRHIESEVLTCMQRWGYRQIITPTLEYYDTVGAASSTSDQKQYKLLDKKGTTIVLRSDITAPIARVASSLLKEAPLPLRLAYHANVFRSIEEGAGHEAEFYQTGVELIGDASAEGDAEIVALTIACLKAAGIERFKLAVGHVGFLNGLFHEALDVDIAAQNDLKAHLYNRNYVGYQEEIQQLNISQQSKQRLNGILRLRGTEDICQQAKAYCSDPLARASLAHLCEVWEVLESYGVQEHVMIDLTMIGDFSYYTGMTFEGYASGLGFPVCSGGRYDHLLEQFGRPAPATGFALKTNRILEVIDSIALPAVKRILIAYIASHRQKAFAQAEKLRQQPGHMVETQLVGSQESMGQILRFAGGFEYKGERYDEIIQYTAEGED